MPPVQTPVEGFTYTGAGFPKLDVIVFVGHGVLNERKAEACILRKVRNIPLSWSRGRWLNQKRFELVEWGRSLSRDSEL